MGTRLNSAGDPALCHRSWSLSFLHLLSALSPHCFFPPQEPSDTFLQWFSYDNKVVNIEVLHVTHSGTHVTRLPAQWWKAAGWVQSIGEHQPSLQTLHCPLTNTDTAPGIGIHSLYQAHYPLIHTKFPQCQMTFLCTWSNAFSRSTKAM